MLMNIILNYSMPVSLIMHTHTKVVIHVEIKKTDIKLASTFCNAT